MVNFVAFSSSIPQLHREKALPLLRSTRSKPVPLFRKMLMMQFMRFVVSKHPSVVLRGQIMVDKGKIVPGDLARLVPPNLLSKQFRSALKEDERHFVGSLPQPSLLRHSSSLAQVGIDPPYLGWATFAIASPTLRWVHFAEGQSAGVAVTTDCLPAVQARLCR